MPKVRHILAALAAVAALSSFLQELPSFQNIEGARRSLSGKDEAIYDPHSTQTTALPLRDWEQQSLQALYDAAALSRTSPELSHAELKSQQKQLAVESCQPPPGIPPQCCIGTFAGMGRIIHNQRHQCAHDKTLHQMELLQQQSEASNEQCDVCLLLESLRSINQTMAFVGDSMSHQIFQGLVCEFYRRNYVVKESSVHFQNKQVARQRGRRGKETNNLPANSRSNDPQHETIVSSCNGINHCLHLVRTIEISSPQWPTKQPVRLKFFHVYRLPFGDANEEEWVLTAADILVLNFGLHWGANYGNQTDRARTAKQALASTARKGRSEGGLVSPQNPPTPQHLKTVLADFLNKIAQRGRTQQVLFRETSAQHFDADGGDYSFVKPKATKRIKQELPSGTAVQSDLLHRPPLQCVSHQAGSTSGWRERVVQEAAKQANYSASSTPSFVILPFFEHTKGLHDVHPYDERHNQEGGGGGGDCTHYCSSPYLYLPLWKSIRQALVQRQQRGGHQG